MSNSDYAPGLPEKGVYGDLGKLTPGQLVTYALQEHSTDRQRGRSHYDLRLGTPDTGLFSWAVPKAKLPTLKEKLLAVRTELHRYGYGGFKGRIGSGYGAGTVRQADYGDAIIHSQSPRSIQFTIAHAKVPARYRLMHVKDDKWILTNTTPQGVDIPEMKPTFKLLTEAELPNALAHAKEVQAKIDGALGIFHIDPKGRMEAYSPRRRVTGEPISYGERLGLGQESHPELADTVLRGEVYGEKQAQEAIPFNELSGLMNANLNKAIPAVQARKIALKAALFDVVRYKGMDVSSMPYDQRKALLMKIIGQLPPSKFTLPESASTPEGMQDLMERIRSGKHPMTQEGVVIDNKYKYKIRPDSTGYITGTFPGTGKRQSTAGGILYTDKPGGTEPVGKIGTGFTDAELQEIVSGLGGLMGRPFRFTHRGQTASGNYREPSWAGWETDKPDVKAAERKNLIKDRITKAAQMYKNHRQEVKKALVELGLLMKASTMDKEIPGDAIPLSICNSKGKVKTMVDTEMADTPAKAAKGLSGRKKMTEKAAMLFTTTGPFWMKGCHFDVDLVFLDKQGQVTSFGTMPHNSPNLFYPDPMAKLALELPGGTCRKIGLQTGDRVQVAGS